jgi:c-di-GMP-related signal transduction protein
MPMRFFRRLGATHADSHGDSAPASIVPPSGRGELEVPPEVSGLVRYTWLLDPKKQIIGYRMHWDGGAAQRPAAELQALVDTVAAAFMHGDRGWLMGKVGLLFDVTSETVRDLDWRGLPPKRIILCWRAEDLQDAESMLPMLKILREDGFGNLVAGELPQDKALCELLTHYDVTGGDAAHMTAARTANRRGLIAFASEMGNWADFDALAARRVPVLLGPGTHPPLVVAPRDKLQPETILIVRLLQMVQRNEDVREIESALKHDAALTYRVLRLISSPGVGCGIEVESVRHAVAMLGYARLFRFLSQLLTETEARHSPPFLMKKAIIRGRFVELLGQNLLGAKHGDNLFLAGMFSVIDQLLGMSMTDLMEKVQLADAVQIAILKHEGIYGPMLSLAMTCELDPAGAEAMAERLFMSTHQVNAAHLAAIAWAQEITRGEAMY